MLGHGGELCSGTKISLYFRVNNSSRISSGILPWCGRITTPTKKEKKWDFWEDDYLKSISGIAEYKCKGRRKTAWVFHTSQKFRNSYKIDEQADNEAEKRENQFSVWLLWHILCDNPKVVPLSDFSFSSDISHCVSFDEGLCWQTLHLKYQHNLVLSWSNDQWHSRFLTS